MARKSNARFEAKKREQARKKRAEDKRARKAARAEQKRSGNGNHDADLEGIVAGPQPKSPVDAAEVALAVERAMNPGAVAAEGRRMSPAQAAAARLFVGHLDLGTRSSTLRKHFEGAGFSVVEADVVTDRASGRSRGFAFVQLDSPSAARDAVERLDGEMCDGSELRVRLAQDKS